MTKFGEVLTITKRDNARALIFFNHQAQFFTRQRQTHIKIPLIPCDWLKIPPFKMITFDNGVDRCVLSLCAPDLADTRLKVISWCYSPRSFTFGWPWLWPWPGTESFFIKMLNKVTGAKWELLRTDGSFRSNTGLNTRKHVRDEIADWRGVL